MESEELNVTDKRALISRNACSNCKRMLNVSPVFCLELNNTIQKICGRCTHIVEKFNGKKFRQQLFEDLAEHLTYSCSNKQYGCKSIFPWQNVVSHETMCKYQYLPCVLSFKDLFPGKDCNWMGNITSLDEHIETAHKDCIINQSALELVFETPLENKIVFTHVGNRLVTIVIIPAKLDKYYCLLMINGNDMDSHCYQYQLELYNNDNKEQSIILRRYRLEPLGNLRENLKSNDKLLEIDLNQISHILGSTKNISGRFGIVRKNKKHLRMITGKEATAEKVLPLDESILQELECPVCNQYMIAKIYVCHAGKSNDLSKTFFVKTLFLCL